MNPLFSVLVSVLAPFGRRSCRHQDGAWSLELGAWSLELGKPGSSREQHREGEWLAGDAGMKL